MTNENKTVAQLMEGVEADVQGFVRRYSQEQLEFRARGHLPSFVVGSDDYHIASYRSDEIIERVFGPVLAERDEQIERLTKTVLQLELERRTSEEHIRAQAALLVQQERELTELRSQTRKLDVSETQLINERDNAEEAISQAYYLITGKSPEWSNLFGHAEALEEIDKAQTLLRQTIISQHNELSATKEQNASLSRAVAELTEAGDARYLAGVRVGRAQMLAEMQDLPDDDSETDPLQAFVNDARELAARQVKIPHGLQRAITDAQTDMLHENPLQALADESQQMGPYNGTMMTSNVGAELLALVRVLLPIADDYCNETKSPSNASQASYHALQGYALLNRIQRAEAAKKESGE